MEGRADVDTFTNGNDLK